MLAKDFYGDHFRWFIGVVKDVGDDRSRVRVRIFGIHHTEDQTRVSDGDLPWALVLYPTTGGQTSSGNASHGLTPGTWVFGMFADGEDSQQPVILGVVNGGYNSMNNSPGNPVASDTGDQNTNNNNNNNEIPSTQLTGDGNTQKVYNYFYERISKEGLFSGDIKSIVAALVGNFQIESNCSPGAINPNDKGQQSVGIAQWRAERREKFLRYFGLNGMSSNSCPPLDKQLDYVWQELHTSEKSAYNKLLTTTTIQDSTAAMILYERDASYKKIGSSWQVDRSSSYYQKKLNAARQIFSSLSYTGGTTASSSNPGREV